MMQQNLDLLIETAELFKQDESESNYQSDEEY